MGRFNFGVDDIGVPAGLTYTGPGGVRKVIDVTTISRPLQTNFGIPGIKEYSSPGAILVHTITFPDKGTYTFEYDATPNVPGAFTSRVTNATLPARSPIPYFH